MLFTNELTVFKRSRPNSNGYFYALDGKLVAAADEENQLWLIDKRWLWGSAGKCFSWQEIEPRPKYIWLFPKAVECIVQIHFMHVAYWEGTRGKESEQDGEHWVLLFICRQIFGFFVWPEDLIKPNASSVPVMGKHFISRSRSKKDC